MDTIQNSTLVLYTSNLPVNTSNQYGSTNSNLTELTWKNINIKQILNGNYDKYYKFNLSLSSVIIPQNGTVIPDAECNVLLYMSGLSFDQSNTYSTLTLSNTNYAYIGNMRLNTASTSTSSIINYSMSFYTTFLKGAETIDITINLKSATPTSGTYNLQFASPYPQMVYTFNISPVIESLIVPFPVQGEQNITYKQRLFK